MLDGSDNFETRYLVSDACFLAAKPLITAALGMFDGSLTTIRAHEKNADGEFNPTYRCLFPEPPPPGTVPACAEAGVMGALAGVLGSMMALEAIREIVGFGEGLVGRLLMVDARAMRFETLRYQRDPLNPLNGDALVITEFRAASVMLFFSLSRKRGEGRLRRGVLLAVHVHELRVGIAVAGSNPGRECFRECSEMCTGQLHVERAECLGQPLAPRSTSGTMSLPCAATQAIATCAGVAGRSPAIARKTPGEP